MLRRAAGGGARVSGAAAWGWGISGHGQGGSPGGVWLRGTVGARLQVMQSNCWTCWTDVGMKLKSSPSFCSSSSLLQRLLLFSSGYFQHFPFAHDPSFASELIIWSFFTIPLNCFAEDLLMAIIGMF
jgi:hypothetical protein